MPATFDFSKIKAAPFANLQEAIDALYALYGELDAQTDAVAKRYPALPCHCGCDACCHEAVFVTPLEFWAIISWLQEHEKWDLLAQALEKSRAIVSEHREVIEAFNLPPKDGESDHFSLAKELHYTCPFLDKGCCQIYPVRSLIARLFGRSFEKPGVVYGCELMEEALVALGGEVKLPSTQFWTKKLSALPYTDGRQVLPYFMVKLYGEK